MKNKRSCGLLKAMWLTKSSTTQSCLTYCLFKSIWFGYFQVLFPKFLQERYKYRLINWYSSCSIIFTKSNLKNIEPIQNINYCFTLYTAEKFYNHNLAHLPHNGLQTKQECCNNIVAIKFNYFNSVHTLDWRNFKCRLIIMSNNKLTHFKKL